MPGKESRASSVSMQIGMFYQMQIPRRSSRSYEADRFFRLLDRSTDEGEEVMGFSSAAAECGGDVGLLSHSEETDDEIAQACHYLGS